MTNEVNTLTEQELVNSLSNHTQVFLFLDADYFEDGIREIETIDFRTSIKLLWENTIWEDDKEDGPLLTNIYAESNLLRHFIDNWALENRGIVIQSDYSLEAIHKHLQSLLWVREPDNSLSRLRLYEPRKLRGLVNAMQTEQQQQDFMGPIKGFIWQENRGDQHQWLYNENPAPHAPAHSLYDMPWFHFSQIQNEIIAENEVEYWHHQVALILRQKFALATEHAFKQAHTLLDEAKEFGFEQKTAQEYACLRLQYGDFRQQPMIQNELQNMEYTSSGRLNRISQALSKMQQESKHATSM